MRGVKGVDVGGGNRAVKAAHEGLVFGTELGVVGFHAGRAGVSGLGIEPKVPFLLAIFRFVEEEV